MKNVFKNKWFWIVLLAIIILYLVYRYGKRFVPKDVKLPPDTQPGGATNFNPGTYTDAVFSDIDCVFCLRQSKPYLDLLTLSNSQLVAVYNDWNKRYFSKYNETLPTALSKELTVPFLNQAWLANAHAVIERYKTLGLI